ncbi:hypothetical protein HanPI659440_Chr06g0233171 [Helianthus annuus]|nr:hypothetical protein HanPI659440_Chr06g0233171 [Helianthus annuus]
MFFGDNIQLKREENTSRTTTAAMKPTSEMNMMTSSNKLLAGYMAYEFLTNGTVLGHKFGTDRIGLKRRRLAVMRGMSRLRVC